MPAMRFNYVPFQSFFMLEISLLILSFVMWLHIFMFRKVKNTILRTKNLNSQNKNFYNHSHAKKKKKSEILFVISTNGKIISKFLLKIYDI